jgi:hypothetical protein
LDKYGNGGLACANNNKECCVYPFYQQPGCEDFVWGRGCYATCTLDKKQKLKSCLFYKYDIYESKLLQNECY